MATLALFAALQQDGTRLELWYTKPAEAWTEALPIGGGRIGAMVFGGIEEERIQFNEDTLWSGQPHSYAREGAVEHLAEIRRLLWEGKQQEADELAMREFMSDPIRQKAYQNFGDLRISFLNHAGATDYVRKLDLDSALATVEYTIDGDRFSREAFASYRDGVIVYRLEAHGEKRLNFSAWLVDAHEGEKSINSKNEFIVKGRVEEGGVRYEARMSVTIEEGTISSNGLTITVEGAKSATVLLAPATSFVSPWSVNGDPNTRAMGALVRARRRGWEDLRKRHIEDHQGLFRRMSLDLGHIPEAERLPTDERLVRFAEGKPDPGLAVLLAQYGRYLMIASSRPGTQPANLQGIWNDSNRPPWESKYTVNINTEMNYWAVERANLSECHDALFDALEEVARSGAEVAREHYGARGWVLHHNFDIWRGAAPINAANHGIWQTGGAWLSQHFWWRWLYSQDRTFLKERAYPIMKGASLFFLDALTEHPVTGELVSGPSNSPEIGGLVMGPTMDHNIIRHLLRSTADAASELGIDEDLQEELRTTADRIAKNKIGQYGQLQEWLEDKDDPNNKHRHVSHLWGLHPGEEITVTKTPELFKAAQKSLEMRGDGGTGWSMGWKINFWARLRDGDHAHLMLRNQLKPVGGGGGGTYPNMFDAHPPFQIDGNFGALSGILEMIIQDHDGAIEILPALPRAWPSGSLKGVRARGAVELDISWKDGEMTEVVVRGEPDTTVTIRYRGNDQEVTVGPGGTSVSW